ncbi:MAG: hypothetical protein KIT45_04315 [Fimbriimonadia bacterium]|nr:hypothetical protein [Fimbriimonadia bacterium]
MRSLIPLFLMIALLSFSAAQAPAPDWRAQPDLIVVIQAMTDGTRYMTWTFDKKVDHSSVQQQIQLYEQFSQIRAQRKAVSDDTLARDPKPSDYFTIAEFYTSGLVDMQQGALMLDPLIKTFAHVKRIHFYALLPTPTEFKGYPYYNNEHLTSWTQAEPQMWRGIIELKTHQAELLTIPPVKPAEQTAPAKTTPVAVSPLRWIGAIITFFVAILVGVGVYWVARRNIQSAS